MLQHHLEPLSVLLASNNNLEILEKTILPLLIVPLHAWRSPKKFFTCIATSLLNYFKQFVSALDHNIISGILPVISLAKNPSGQTYPDSIYKA